MSEENKEITHKKKNEKVSIKKLLIYIVAGLPIIVFIASFFWFNTNGGFVTNTTVKDNASSIMEEIKDLNVEVLSVEMNITRMTSAGGGYNIEVYPGTGIYKVNLANAKVIESKEGDVFIRLPEIEIDIPQINESKKETLVKKVKKSWKGDARKGVDSAITAQADLQELLRKKLNENEAIKNSAKEEAIKIVKGIIENNKLLYKSNLKLDVFF